MHGPLFILALMIVLTGVLAPGAQARSDIEPPMTYGDVPDQLYAIRNPYLFKHNAGLLSLQITNLGVIGNPFSDDLSAGWRGGEYLFYSGPWIGAIGSGSEARVSTASPFELRPDLDARWTIYESFEGLKGGIRLGTLGAAVANDDGDGLVDEDFHNGLDDDGDGQIDEDFAAIGQQMFSCMYRDDTPEAIAQVPEHFPLGVLVRQRSIQWAVDGISEMVGIEYEIINTGEQRLKEMHLGFIFDSDIGFKDEDGFWSDDMAGWDIIDTTLTVEGVQGACGSVDAMIPVAFMWDGGGSVPGVFGSLLLGHPTDENGIRAPKTVSFHTVDWFSAGGDAIPTTDAERYQFMSSGTQRAENPRSGVAMGSTSTPNDYHMVWSTGRFGGSFNPGESRVFQIAHVVGEGFTGFRENAANAWRVWNGAYVDVDENPDTGIDGKERCLQILEPGGQIVWDDPCDTLAIAVIYDETPPCDVAGPHYVDSDCDPCTGVDGRETQINWIGAVAPPNPLTNLDPVLRGFPPDPPVVHPGGDGQVTVQWDNRPELWKEPLTDLDIFTGYRVWKVSDWADSVVGPGPEDWVQIAEFRTDVPGSSPSNLRHAINTDVDSVGMTDDGKAIYPIGRYELVDTDVVGSVWYYYAVTAFGTITTTEGTIEVSGLPASPISWAVVLDDMVPVRLLSFIVNRVAGKARLQWEVAEADNHAGFHVHREEAGMGRIQLTKSLLSGRTEYEFVDSGAPPDQVSYWLQELSRSGEASWHGPVTLEATAVLPGRLSLGTASPNPFQARMNLAYALPDTRPVRISVYDITGRRVRVLVDDIRGPGEYRVEWSALTDSGVRVAPGLYFIRFEAGAEVLSRKVLYVR